MSPTASARLLFRLGAIVHAEHSRWRQSSLDFLVEQGIIPADAAMPDAVEGTRPSLVRVFEELSAEEKAGARAALRSRASVILFEATAWQEGTIDYSPYDLSPAELGALGKKLADDTGPEEAMRVVSLRRSLPCLDMRVEAVDGGGEVDVAQQDELARALLEKVASAHTVRELLSAESADPYFLVGALQRLREAHRVALKPALAALPLTEIRRQLQSAVAVYNTVMRKLGAVIHERCGETGQVELEIAIGGLRNRAPAILGDVQVDRSGAVDLEAVLPRLGTLAFMSVGPGFRDVANAMVVHGLLAARNALGDAATCELIEQLTPPLSSLLERGKEQHREAARDILSAIDFAVAVPSTYGVAETLADAGLPHESETFLRNIPATHPDAERAGRLSERIAGLLASASHARTRELELRAAFTGAHEAAELAFMHGDLKLLRAEIERMADLEVDAEALLEIELRMSSALERYRATWSESQGCPRINPRFDMRGLQNFELAPHCGYLLSRIDGQTTTHELLVVSGMGTDEAMFALGRLQALGIVAEPQPIAKRPVGQTAARVPGVIATASGAAPPTPPLAPRTGPAVSNALPAASQRTVDAPPAAASSASDHPARVAVVAPVAAVNAGAPSAPEPRPAPMTAAPDRAPAAPPVREAARPTDSRRAKARPDAAEGTPPEVRDEAGRLFSAGMSTLYQGNAAAAADLFRRAIALAPGRVAYYGLLDQATAKMSSAQSAELALRAVQARNTGQLREAVSLFEAACRHAPKDVGNILALAQTLLDLRRFDTAKVAANRVIALEPGNSHAYVLLARALKAEGNIAEAHLQLKLALRWNPKDDEARRELKGLP